VKCDEPGLRPKGTCTNPLGLAYDGSGRFTIPDSAFKSKRGHLSPGGGWAASAQNARLYFMDDYTNKRIGAWCSPTSDVTMSSLQMLTVDLGSNKRITYIATQGRNKYFERVSQFKVEYSDDNRTFKKYTEGGEEKIFQGNCDHVTPVLNYFAEPLEARYFRYIPWKWNYPCVRMELYGCDMDDEQPEPIIGELRTFGAASEDDDGFCSRGGNPVQRTTPVPTTLKPTPDTSCMNQRKDGTWCEDNKDKCTDYSTGWTDYMKRNCFRSCNYC